MITRENAPFFIGGALLLGGIIWIARKGVSGVVGDVAQEAAEIPAEIVQGVGEAIGIPRTDAQRCEIAKANGQHLEASQYCTAVDFASWEASNVAGSVQSAYKKAKEIFQ